MISFLSGTLLSKDEKALILLVNGVGYQIAVPRAVISAHATGDSLELFTHLQVREDELSLYGFLTKEEWQLFRLLLTVSGVGPKSALEILNAPISRVRQAIATKDTAFLVQIRGLGKKTAERILVDLAGKVLPDALEEAVSDSPHPKHDELITALTSLGYQRHKVVDGLKKVPAELTDEEAIIKYFLQHI